MKRFKRGARVTALTLGLATSIGLAYFVGSFIADGTHEGTIGHGGTGTKVLSVSVNWEDGKLSPTVPVPLTMSVNNTSKSTVTFKHTTFTFTPSAPGCSASWFTVHSSSTMWNNIVAHPATLQEVEYAPGVHSLGQTVGVEGAGPTFSIEMVEPESGPVDMSACEDGGLKLAVHLIQS